MTEFQRPSFSVKTGGRKPEECGHGWVNKDRWCVLCGTLVFPCPRLGTCSPAACACFAPTPTEETPGDE